LDVLSFSDGRAGATVNFDGELVFLTFVQQGDRWLIDAWQEPAPVATPAAESQRVNPTPAVAD
jgi:hypothetical protein